MTTRVVTDTVRFSFCHVCSPRKNEFNGKDEFSTQILIAKSDTATVAAIKAAAKAALLAKFGDKIPAKARNPMRDGDTETKADGSELSAEYRDHYFMTVKSSKRPGIIDAQGVELLGSDDVASGDHGRVSLNSYAYDTAGNKGVAFGLNNVQLTKKGDSLGGARPSAFADFGVSSTPAKAPAAEVADDDNW